MFDSPYPFQNLGEKLTLIRDPGSKINYRFKAKYRTYFVTLEIFTSGVVAIKYCDRKDIGAHNAYEKIFNDGDAFKVVTTCLFIMLDYWKKNKSVSFVFYAVPRSWKERDLDKVKMTEENLRIFKYQYSVARFNIYQYAMINLFPPQYFVHMRDTRNSIYILLNKKQLKPKTTVKNLTAYLFKNFELIFEPDK